MLSLTTRWLGKRIHCLKKISSETCPWHVQMYSYMSTMNKVMNTTQSSSTILFTRTSAVHLVPSAGVGLKCDVSIQPPLSKSKVEHPKGASFAKTKPRSSLFEIHSRMCPWYGTQTNWHCNFGRENKKSKAVWNSCKTGEESTFWRQMDWNL